jgi:hypothetical protein
VAVELVFVGDASEGLNGVEDGHGQAPATLLAAAESGMAHGGEHLDPGLGLGGQGVVHPLAVVVEDAVDVLAALLEAAALDGFKLVFKVQRELLDLAVLQALQVLPACLAGARQDSGGEGCLLACSMCARMAAPPAACSLHRPRWRLPALLATVGQLARLEAGTLAKASKGSRRKGLAALAHQCGGHLPLHQQRLALAVGHQAHQHEGLFARRSLRRFAAAARGGGRSGEHAVAQPFHDGVLRPQVVQLGQVSSSARAWRAVSMASAMRCGSAHRA